MDCLHPIENKHKNQKHAIEKGRKQIDSSIPIVEVPIMLARVEAIILCLLLALIPDINSPRRKGKSEDQNAKIEEVSQNMHILVG